LLRIYPDEEFVIALAANLSLRGENLFEGLPNQLLKCFLDE